MTAEERGAEEMSAAEAAAAAASEGLDITAKCDGGVLKVVKKEGTGTECPMIGDKVTVHYTGWLLDGSKFDSSRDRKDKFSFDFGKGEVIKAWDIAVGTMKIGELCQIICKPEYAYGTAGSPPKIPANATLFFEIELFEFKGKDLTDDEDGGIIRRIRKKGEGYSKPNEGAFVEIEIEGRHEDRVFDKRELRFEVGEAENYDLPPGVDKTLQKMEKLEEAVVYLKPSYGFGSVGKPKFQIPPDADLQYEIKLKSFEKAKEPWEMNTQEKLEQGAIAKEKGTQYFKARGLRTTCSRYRCGIRLNPNKEEESFPAIWEAFLVAPGCATPWPFPSSIPAPSDFLQAGMPCPVNSAFEFSSLAGRLPVSLWDFYPNPTQINVDSMSFLFTYSSNSDVCKSDLPFPPACLSNHE